jgi:hypothetical protein
VFLHRENSVDFFLLLIESDGGVQNDSE